mmetsp:Transcript_93409/g.204416  ORF Transcript_93409/g.204416 Transcript_93409/m.204416 type:complete len:495 (-) Transcript_93409:197-1681(-)|eukprot:CAMPEP_0206445326 /NCGR_PEP_ID=MMETSP0324_2-20121206/15442_1 /ASSEMBLY_ACC=CAM_ASM_000836 /TAXON_ID=2866 /ORGANISM="Crypthecodinium cohnii, Strain Seligo" /LENGTH=494 /DNA_ID=CAMNT_0053913521 /DNA_START=100 /DNA_END=1584 /DNA_ORIENTATION=+
MSRISAILATLTLVAANAEEPSSYLSDVYSGKVPKSKVEVVLAQHDEDIAWSDPLQHVRTVYCKGSHCADESIRLPNAGREGNTFLHHIVKNYDNLADWTVFSQAEKPTDGYFDHKRGGGHMLTGSKFEDYIVHHEASQGKADSLFLMTSKVHLPTLRHALRTSFKVDPFAAAAQIHSKSAVCPKDEGADVWGQFRSVPQVRHFLGSKCGVEEHVLGDALRSFWEDFVQLPFPSSEVVHYAQGARFAVSRERLQQRPKAYYQQLLDAVSSEEDPCMNYLFEFVWYYVMGSPTGEACPITADDELASVFEGRILAAGVSGISMGEDDEPKPIVVISGTMDMEVDEADLEAFTNNDTMKAIVEESIASVLKVDPEWVNVTFDTTSSSSSARRLATTIVVVTYEITFPPEASANTAIVDEVMNKLKDSTTTSGALTSAISTAAAITVTVKQISTPTLVTNTQTSTTTTTATMEASTSSSVRSILTSAAAMMIAALTL